MMSRYRERRKYSEWETRTNMPTRDELLACIEEQYCWWCGTCHSVDGNIIGNWGSHFTRAHGLALQDLRDTLLVGRLFTFSSKALRAINRVRPHRLTHEKAVQMGKQGKGSKHNQSAVMKRTPQRAKTKRFCNICDKKFWRPGNRTCSPECASKAQSIAGSNTETRARGEDNGRAVLTKSKVLAIRKRYATGNVSQDELAKQNNIMQTTISAIVLGQSWAHVGGPITRPMPLAERVQKRMHLHE